MPSGFFATLAGTMLRRNFAFSSYSLMIGGKIAPATYQWRECGKRTIDTGMLRPPAAGPPVSHVCLTGGIVTRRSGLAQSAGLDGYGGEKRVTLAAWGSGT